DEQPVLEIARGFDQRGRKTRRLQVSHAFHSPRMDGMLEEFRRVARDLSYAPPRTPVVSNVTGEIATGEQLCNPEDWGQHVRQPAGSADATRRLEALGVTTYLELGPDGVLAAMAQDSLTEPASAVAVPVLRRDKPEPATLVTALGHAHARGAGPDWTAV